MKTTPTHLAQTRPLFLIFKQFLKQRVISLFSFFLILISESLKTLILIVSSLRGSQRSILSILRNVPKESPRRSGGRFARSDVVTSHTTVTWCRVATKCLGHEDWFFWKNMIQINSIWFKMIEHWFNWFNSLYLFVMSLHFSTCFYCGAVKYCQDAWSMSNWNFGSSARGSAVMQYCYDPLIATALLHHSAG